MKTALFLLCFAFVACAPASGTDSEDAGIPIDANGFDARRNVDSGGNQEIDMASLSPLCVPSGGGRAIAQISAGGQSSCALYQEGSIVCWGDGAYGELGDGKSKHDVCGRTDCAKSPVAVLGISDAVQISVGADFACALHKTGEVSCWGVGFLGNLGDGRATHDPGCPLDCVHGPVKVMGLRDAVQVAAGTYGNACAVRRDGTVACWGNNDHGQLGDGLKTHETCSGGMVAYDCSHVPVAVSGLTGAVEVGVGDYHACARRTDGRVVCWGGNGSGQLGNPLTGDHPIEVTGLHDAVSLTTGIFSNCALQSGGQATCWGYSANGQLGDGMVVHTACPEAYDCSVTPVAVQGLADGKGISGQWTHVCALKADQTLVCWGDNSHVELGDGVATHVKCKSGSDCSPTPVAVKMLADVVAVSANSGFACALRKDCSAACWGLNANAQLGDGTTTDQPTPVKVLGL